MVVATTVRSHGPHRAGAIYRNLPPAVSRRRPGPAHVAVCGTGPSAKSHWPSGVSIRQRCIDATRIV
jgi:hypothetical protein